MSSPRVLFVADQTAASTRTEQAAHPGGAEMTDEAAIEACPWPIEVETVETLDAKDLAQFDVHVVGNFDEATDAQIEELCRLGRHVLFEHDVRICSWRGNFPASPEYIHRYAQRCVCPHVHLRELFDTALGTVFLSHRQLEVYRANPFFDGPPALVLGSSLMNREFLERVEAYRADPPEADIEAAVVYSGQANKGFERSREFCRDRGVEPFVIRDLEPEEVLEVLERTERFVHLPTSLEAAGRTLVEARFLGCEVVSNPNAGVCGESWWHLPDDEALEVLADAPRRLWRLVDRLRSREDRSKDGGSPGRWNRIAESVATTGLQAVERMALTGPLIERMTRRVRRRADDARVVTPSQPE